MTPGPLHQLLQHDHARFDALLSRTDATPGTIDLDAYELFRGGLLRHIGIEEKLLLPAARRRRNGDPLPIARQLRADHAALAALLVPTPTHAILATIRTLLTAHNPLEDAPGGVYDICEALAGPDLDALLTRVKAAPEVPLAKHFDGPRAFASIETLLHASAAARAK